MVVPAAAESPRERESLHTAPHKRTVGTSCLRVADGMFGSLTNQTRQEQDSNVFILHL